MQLALAHAALLALCLGLPGCSHHTPAATPVRTDDSGPQIFPESWRQPPIDATAEPLNAELAPRAEKLIAHALAKYPAPLLRDSLKAVFVVGKLRYSGIAAGGTNSRSIVYLAYAPRYAPSDVERNFHAEFSSILLRNHNTRFDAAAWIAANPEGFAYRTGGVAAVKNNLASLSPDPVLLEQGFFHQYSTSSLENDFNSYASRLFMGDPALWDAIDHHPRVAAKVNIVLRFYESLHPDLNRRAFERLRANR